MQEIFNYIKAYVLENFDLRLYSGTAIWLLIIFTINYSLNFEDDYVDRIRTYGNRAIGHFLFQFIPFIVPVFFIAIVQKLDVLKSKEFWIKVLVAFLFLGLYRAVNLYPAICKITPLKGCIFQYKVLIKYVRLVMLFIPLLIFYRLDKKHLRSFYGLSFKWKSIKMYFPLLGIMAFLIIFACFFDQIQKYYPLYIRSGGKAFAKLNNLPQWVPLLIYESSYLFNFISIEFFFRGFLILSLARLFGPQIVLPAVCLYATIHFGKPFLEAFSSIFGGYILCVLTLKTENIWGGIFVHAGIAGMMELFAWLI